MLYEQTEIKEALELFDEVYKEGIMFNDGFYDLKKGELRKGKPYELFNKSVGYNYSKKRRKEIVTVEITLVDLFSLIDPLEPEKSNRRLA